MTNSLMSPVSENPTSGRIGASRNQSRNTVFCFVLFFFNLHENVPFGSINLDEFSYKDFFQKKKKKNELAEKVRHSPVIRCFFFFTHEKATLKSSLCNP